MRVRRSLLNFGTMVLYTGVTMVVAIWASRWLQDWLGPKRYGGFRVVNDAYGWLTLLELGLGGAMGPLLAAALGKGDEKALAATVSAGMRGYLRVSAVSLVVGLALTPVIPWFARDLTLAADVADMQIAWVVALAAFAPLALLPMRSIVEARQLGYVVNLLLTTQTVLITGVSLWLAKTGWGIKGQSLALVLGSWAFNLTVAVGVHSSHPGLIRAALAAPPDPETRRAVRGLSVPTLLVNVSGRLSLLTDNLVIGSMLGLERVYSLYQTQRLASLGQSVLQGVGGATWAGMAELHAQGDHDTFNRRLVELSRLVAVLAAVGLAPVVAFNRAFTRVWLGADGPNFLYGGDAVIAVAALNVYLVSLPSLWAWCFSATGKIRRVAPLAVVGAGLNIVLSVAMTSRLGLAGPLVGTTLAQLAVVAWALPLRLRSDFGTPLAPLARAVLIPLAWGVASAAGLWWLAQRLAPTTWGGVIAAVALSALASLAFSVAVLLPADERELWRRRFFALHASRREPS